MTVHHHADAKILTCFTLAMFAKLGDCTKRRGFRCLTTGVGITLGIQHKDVDVLGQAQHMIEAAKAYVIGPAVTANQPDRFLDQRIGIGQQRFGFLDTGQRLT